MNNNKIATYFFVFFALLSIRIFGQEQPKKQSKNEKITHYRKLIQEENYNPKYVEYLCILYQTQNPDSAIFFGKKYVLLNEGKKVLLAKAHNNLGVSHWYKGQLDSAKICFEKSIKINQPIEDSSLWAKNNANLGILEDNDGNLRSAVKKYKNALSYFEGVKDTLNAYKTLVNIANLHSNLNEHAMSLVQYQKALALALKVKNPEYLSSLYEGIGLDYLDLENYELAEKNLRQGMKLATEDSDVEMQSRILKSLGYLHLFKKEYEEAIHHFKKSLKVNQKKFTENLYENYAGLSYAYSEINQYQKALNALEKVKYDEIVDVNRYLKILRMESKTLFNINQYKKAYTTLVKYHEKNDSINSVAFQKSILNYQKESEYQEKQNQILQQNIQLEKNKTVIYKSKVRTIIIIITVAILLAITIWYFIKRKRKEKERLIKKQLEASDKEKNRIGQDLHDGIGANLINFMKKTEGMNPELLRELQITYEEVRGLSHQLSESKEEKESFLDSLQKIVPDDSNLKKYNLSIRPVHLKPNSLQRNHLRRIVQELIANDIKHSEASVVDISIRKENGKITLKYSDNSEESLNIKEGGIGLKNIRDRVDLLKGDMHINTEKGFKLELTFLES